MTALKDRLAKSQAATASSAESRPPLCTCEVPRPRWRKIDGQIFCLVCTPPPDGAGFLVEEFLHLPQNANLQSGSMVSGSGFQAGPDDDLPPYEPLERSVPWSHPSIVRSIYEGYGLLPKSTPDEIATFETAIASDAVRTPSKSEPGSAVEGDQDLASWALSLTQERLPPEPWQFAPHSRITCNRRWLAYLQADVRRGRDGPRAKTGALQKQLRELRLLIDQNQ